MTSSYFCADLTQLVGDSIVFPSEWEEFVSEALDNASQVHAAFEELMQ